MGVLQLYDGDHSAVASTRPAPSSPNGRREHRITPASSSDRRQMIAERQPIHILDRREIRRLPGRYPSWPLRWSNWVEYVLPSYSAHAEGRAFAGGGDQSTAREVRAFTQKQIELISTFADQAVIAIENVRLFKELEARKDHGSAGAANGDQRNSARHQQLAHRYPAGVRRDRRERAALVRGQMGGLCGCQAIGSSTVAIRISPVTVRRKSAKCSR